jgi:hypothetical protein
MVRGTIDTCRWTQLDDLITLVLASEIKLTAVRDMGLIQCGVFAM